MALKNTFDLAEARRRLSDWLPGVLSVDGPVDVTDLVIPEASGMSSQTVLFEAVVDDGDARAKRGFVVRVPPEGEGVFPDYDMAREARVMSVLATATDVPVPNVVAHETTGDVLGTEFLLVDRVHGEVPADDPPFTTAGFVVELSDQQRATMWDAGLRAIAGIQSIDPLDHGLGFLRHTDLGGDTVLDEELAYWRRFYQWAAGDQRSPTIDAAFEKLEATKPTDDGPLVVSWGDGRFGNLMFGPDQEVTGVFDWEMATLGRREVDLGYWLFFDEVYSSGLGIPRLTGFPGRDATVARFEELTGHTVRDLEWFEAWAALRGACLIVRVGNLMISHGFLPEGHAMPWNNPAAQVLAQLLDLPQPSGEAGWITGNRDR
ncbi:phosphotransferase family protein [Mycobacterium talmoniae]|uniref:Phosphotransferase n=1 Tax=Mycobacterium talmoniae TaxID=1858794 RepID=A0A1S1NN25_9MYCO|nr:MULTISPECIES: phosphotransferase family protein [Mycobacterium]OHV05461.1 phosphotransferase [Mycobacterium talmoniae]PQM45424.1 Putative aminoglycoside phosphotransferase [Mycobacterium talmoniae]TDH48285.1 phosphotransferase family protein [Mycobacterium eburneum]